ncbi:MAG: hypothetical protein R3258_01440 [Acidimicrobiia bacterium]|nr:hypothetical protein [Acidimicrobiia bacterium]
MSNRLEGGRTGLAILTVFALVMTLFAAFGGGTARADHANEAQYTFNFVNGATLQGAHGPGGEAPIPFSFFEDFYGVGNVPDGFEGLTIHVSCSDVFTAGWSDDAGSFPNQTDHPEWQIADYTIVRHTPGNIINCTEVFVTTTTAPSTTVTTVPSTTVPTTVPSTTVPTTVPSTTVPTTQPTTTTEETTTTTILGTTITSPTSTLPFTGVESEQMVGIAIMLLGSGLLLTLAGMGRREEA